MASAHAVAAGINCSFIRFNSETSESYDLSGNETDSASFDDGKLGDEE